MTSAEKIEQVLADLVRDTSVEWRLQYGDMIRTTIARLDGWGVSTDCPLSWLAKTTPCAVEEAASRLGLTEVEAAVIANAADGADSTDPVIRRRLLAACRLTEDAS